MMVWGRTTCLLVLASTFVRAQLTIENPKKLEVPEQQAQTLFLNINRVMEAEFHSPGNLENQFRVRLVVGEADERFTIDDAYGNGTVYLSRWNAGRFAVSTMRLAVQHLLGPDRQKKMLKEVMERTRATAPVSVGQLKKEGSPVLAAPQLAPFPDPCIAGITNAAMRSTPCGTPRPMDVR